MPYFHFIIEQSTTLMLLGNEIPSLLSTKKRATTQKPQRGTDTMYLYLCLNHFGTRDQKGNILSYFAKKYLPCSILQIYSSTCQYSTDTAPLTSMIEESLYKYI